MDPQPQPPSGALERRPDAPPALRLPPVPVPASEGISTRLAREPVRLELLRIGKRFATAAGEVPALVDVTLVVGQGEFVAVQGPSGCGKSTLLLIAGGLLAPDDGIVRIEGDDLYALPQERRADLRALRVGFVFQRFHLVPYLDVLDNVLLPSVAMPQGDAVDRARGLLDRFGLADRATHRPGQLSTGECQRVALARALFNRPRLLLADEPTGNLDPENARIVLDAMSAFAKEGGSVLLVTHDPRAAEVADYAVQLPKHPRRQG